MSDLERATALHGLASRATTRGLVVLADDELLHLLAEHRWAVGRLAERQGGVELRSLLNAAVLKTHGLLHQRAKRDSLSVGRALLRSLGGLATAFLVFFGAAGMALGAVLADPVLAYTLVPRAFLGQVEANAWGSRGGGAADLGMTLFYWANNLRASFLALGLGVLGSIPGLLVLGLNGLLLGAVAGFAVNQGIGARLLAWILPHGVPELSALILCAAIGCELDRSWRNPGPLRRRDALADAGRELVPLALIAALLVVCAAPLEGFVAPLELPRYIDGGIALGWLLVLGAGAAYALHRQARSSPS